MQGGGRGVEDRGEGGGGESSDDEELSGAPHPAGLTEHITSEFKYTLHSGPFIWHRGPPAVLHH